MLPLNVAPIVQTGSKLFSNETTWVYWVLVNTKTVGTRAVLKVYDGWDANGVERARIESGYDRPCVFIPPIRCQDALYVEADTEISTYAVGWRTEASLPKKE